MLGVVAKQDKTYNKDCPNFLQAQSPEHEFENM